MALTLSVERYCTCRTPVSLFLGSIHMELSLLRSTSGPGWTRAFWFRVTRASSLKLALVSQKALLLHLAVEKIPANSEAWLMSYV